jgi:hypothetical protein
MALKSIVWAFEQEMFSSSQKFVLITLANFASETGKCYPSVETLARLTSLNIKTVRRSLQGLEEAGIVHDTGKRAGPTQQVKVYQLPEGACDLKPPKIGSLKPGEASLKTPKRLPKDSQNRVAILEPGTGNKNEWWAMPPVPLILNDPRFLKAWDEWLADRRQRRKPVTPRAAERQLRVLEAVGVLGAVATIDAAIAGGWTGLWPKQPATPPTIDRKQQAKPCI